MTGAVAKAFATAMLRPGQRVLSRLELGDNAVGSEGADALAGALALRPEGALTCRLPRPR